jgi:RNA polymerase sigma-70 factor (ECF subfamily)
MVSSKGAEPAERIGPTKKSVSKALETIPPAGSDNDLILRLKKGDRSASDQLIRRYQDRAFALVLRMMSGDREKALELTQEAFLTALRKIESFEGKSSFYTWFYRILVNTSLDALRRRKRWRRLLNFRKSSSDSVHDMSNALEELPSPDIESNPSSVLDARELRSEVDEALRELSDRQRMIFQLKVYEEMRISEIAHILGLAEGTVKSHLFRATRIVRNALADWVEC